MKGNIECCHFFVVVFILQFRLNDHPCSATAAFQRTVRRSSIISAGRRHLLITRWLSLVPHWLCKVLTRQVRSSSSSMERWSSEFVESITRDCLPTGHWAVVSYQPCVYTDVWDLMVQFYISRTPEQRKVRLSDHLVMTFVSFVVRLTRIFFALFASSNSLVYRCHFSVFFCRS